MSKILYIAFKVFVWYNIKNGAKLK